MDTETVWKYGGPGGTRTPDHLVRSQVLYPAELRAHDYHTTNSRPPCTTLSLVSRVYCVTNRLLVLDWLCRRFVA